MIAFVKFILSIIQFIFGAIIGAALMYIYKPVVESWIKKIKKG